MWLFIYTTEDKQFAPKKCWLEDDPFLLSFGHFSGVRGELLNFGRVVPCRVLIKHLSAQHGLIHQPWLSKEGGIIPLKTKSFKCFTLRTTSFRKQTAPIPLMRKSGEKNHPQLPFWGPRSCEVAIIWPEYTRLIWCDTPEITRSCFLERYSYKHIFYFWNSFWNMIWNTSFLSMTMAQNQGPLRIMCSKINHII